MKKINRTLGTALASALVCAAASSFAAAVQDRDASPPQDKPLTTQPLDQMSKSSSMTSKDAKDASSAITAWPTATKKTGQALIEKYGQPDGVTDRMLVWNDKDPWTKVVVYRDAIKQGSLTHDAFLENTVNYKVPLDKVADLIRFDSALVIDETRGTLASNCDTEGCNFLALNLANDIATGKRDVASAKDFFKNTMTKSLSGKSSPEMEKLQFSTSGSSSSSSPDSMNESAPMDKSGVTPAPQPEQSPSGTQPSEPSAPIHQEN
jgi:hypothetical protein